MAKALTLRGNGPGLARALVTPVKVCVGFDPRALPAAQHPKLEEFLAIWDTGATGSVITQEVVNRCGLQPTGIARTHGVGGVHLTERYLVNIMLPNGVGFPHVSVTRGNLPNGVQALIGMDLITQGDFSITNQNGSTVFSFRCPSSHTIDYVEEEKGAKKTPVSVAIMPGRNAPCHCGSGKKFKKCHGLTA